MRMDRLQSLWEERPSYHQEHRRIGVKEHSEETECLKESMAARDKLEAASEDK